MNRNELRRKILYLGWNVLEIEGGNVLRIRDFVPHLQKAFGVVGSETPNLTFLKPHPEAPLFDHGFSSPTYKSKIKQHITEYFEGDYDH